MATTTICQCGLMLFVKLIVHAELQVLSSAACSRMWKKHLDYTEHQLSRFFIIPYIMEKLNIRVEQFPAIRYNNRETFHMHVKPFSVIPYRTRTFGNLFCFNFRLRQSISSFVVVSWFCYYIKVQFQISLSTIDTGNYYTFKIQNCNISPQR